ncbi:hypothetical protein [Edaphobacter acidisoli]|uniref:hypothetical protein n=1 Tax=Edaphobacter acidisoli TaxID=2040573 RepID=UPI00166A688F|nr:hypothetical protein [Edaphobacter acidisoli]
MQQSGPNELPKVVPDRTLAHLEEVLKSPAFSSSKRCQEFLRYIVVETINGRAEAIKERNIALDVFGKGRDFEPGEDSLVRVKAREVRKRLSDYYESIENSDLRIDLPIGGYVPLIHSTTKPISQPSPIQSELRTPQVLEPPRLSRRKFGWMLVSALGLTGAAAVTPFVLRSREPLERLWRPVFDSKLPLLVFIPVPPERNTSQISDRVGIGPAAVLRYAADFLTRHHYPYNLRFGADPPFAQMREQPSLLLGGSSSIWSQRVTSNLRYTISPPDSSGGSYIRDTKTGKIWQSMNPTPNGYADQDYGLLCRIFDSESGQIILIAAGLTTFATEGAGSILFDPALFAAILRNAPTDWETKNFQAVIHVSIIGTTPSSPTIVASYFW